MSNTEIVAWSLGGPLIGAQVSQAEKMRKAQDEALRAQKLAQQKAESAAVSARRRSEMDQRAANRKAPDVAAMLASAQAGATLGAASTMLTPTAAKKPRLATPTLLGGE